MSFDPPERTGRWVENQAFQYEVWTDVDRTLALTWAVAEDPEARRPSRNTVVVDAQGRVVLLYRSVSVRTHPAEVLSDVRALFGDDDP